jgi:Cd2+/Zn2+-exporting ATPase
MNRGTVATEDTARDLDQVVFRIRGMDCAEEVSTLRRALEPLAGVDDLGFDILNQRLTVQFDASAVDSPALIGAVAKTGLRAEPWSPEQPVEIGARLDSRSMLTLASGGALLAGWSVHLVRGGDLLAALGGADPPRVTSALYLLAVALGVVPLVGRALAALRGMRPDMNLLMAIAITGALFLGEWFEAGTVAFLFSLSLLLEAWSVGRAQRAVAALLDLSPREALVLHAGELHGPGDQVSADAHGHRVPSGEVAVGSVVLVRPGERVPLDGEIIAGQSDLDESPITGESRAVSKGPGDPVFAGTINGAGALEMQTTRAASDTTLARIVRLIGEAHGRRSPSERFVERFALIYTPVVMVLTLGACFGPPLLADASWADSFYNALVLLVIACPCALVISTPVSVVCALASAARAGVLIKGGRFIEEPSRVRCLAFDKTGTLTSGRPSVVEVIPFDEHDEQDVLSIAAAIEARSNHPLADAIVRAARQANYPKLAARDVQAVHGRGAEAFIDDKHYWIGSHRLLEERGQETPEQHQRLTEFEAEGNTVVILGTDAHVCGLIVLRDDPREGAADAVAALRREGIGRLVMLTGDNRGTAAAIGARLGIDDIRHGLLPEDKLEAIEELVASERHVAMVGDGVNDTPALARADIGIAMGGAGTDVAIETADIVIMGDDLSRLPWLVRHSRRTLAVIRQNIVASLAIKAIFIGLAFAGWATLWGAIAADMGVSLAVVGNALRLLRGEPVADAPSESPGN